jgi:hypothetical protein
MVEIVNLLDDKSGEYYKYLTSAALLLLQDKECVALGIAEDDVPVGAIVADPGYNGVGEIVSLYIDREKRRNGYGTELVYEAVESLFSWDNMYAVGVTFKDDDETKSGLKSFFEYLEFDISQDGAHGSYTFSLADIASSDKIKGDIDKRVTGLKDVLASTKNALTSRHGAVQSFMVYGEIDEEVSCIVNAEEKDPSDLSCLFVGKSKDALVIVWAEAAEHSLDLVNMLRYAIVNGLKKYGKNMKIRVPFINETSKKLIEKLVGDKAVPVEYIWSAYLPLEWTLEESV